MKISINELWISTLTNQFNYFFFFNLQNYINIHALVFTIQTLSYMNMYMPECENVWWYGYYLFCLYNVDILYVYVVLVHGSGKHFTPAYHCYHLVPKEHFQGIWLCAQLIFEVIHYSEECFIFAYLLACKSVHAFEIAQEVHCSAI